MMAWFTKFAIVAVLAVYIGGFVLAVALWGEAGAGGMLVAFTVEKISDAIVKWHKGKVRNDG